MSVLFANRFKTTLSAGVAAGDVTLTLASVVNLPAIGGGDYCYLTLVSADQQTIEVVKATAVAGNSVTVTRAQEGTAAAAWASGTAVELRFTKQSLADALSGNKAPRGQTLVNQASITPTFSDDFISLTGQGRALTITNPAGTAIDQYGYSIRIKDNGTARAIAYGTQYRAVGVTLPTTTVAGKVLYLGCVWNAADTKFDVVAVAQE